VRSWGGEGEKIAAALIMNSMIHATGGGVIVTESLNNQHFGGTIEDGTYAEVEVADATTEIARAAVQAVFDALPWRARLGLGWTRWPLLGTEHELLFHNGGTGGFRSFTGFVLATHTAVVALSNSARSVDTLGLRILQRVNG
jgi:CubicO group peptidase (beta-lactamase class C family)